MHRLHNLTPATYAASGQKRRRLRPTVSCAPCRLKRTKCDRDHPCEACTARGRTNDCVYGDNEESRTSSITRLPPSNDLNKDRDRLSRLEGHVEHLQQQIVGLASELRVRSRSPNNQDVLTPESSNDISQREQSSLTNSDHSKHVDICSGKFASKQGLKHFIGPTGWTLHIDDIYDNIPTRVNFVKDLEEQWRMYLRLRDLYRGWHLSTPLDWTSVSPPKSTVADLLAMFPAQSDCIVLIRCFLDTFNRLYPVVDGDALSIEMSDFWSSKSTPSNAWVAYAAAAIGVGFLVPVHMLPTSTEIHHRRATGKLLMTAAIQFVISTPLLLRRPDLRTFQTILLSILVQKMELPEPDAGDGIHGALAVAQQMAFTLGLHRDPGNWPNMSEQEALLRRKLWISFLVLDVEHSLLSGTPFLLRPSDSDTTFSLDLGTGSSDQNACHVHCLYAAIPVWTEVLQIANSHSKTPFTAAREISNLYQRLRELVRIINAYLPAPTRDEPFFTASATEEEKEIFILQCQRSMLHRLTNRILAILHIASASPFPSGTRFPPSTHNAILTTAIDTALHAKSLYKHLSNPPLPEYAREGVAHLLMSLFFCEYVRAGMHILTRVRRTLAGNDPPLPPTISTPYGPQRFDNMSLVKLVEDAVCGVISLAEWHAPSAVKWLMFIRGCCAGLRERIRLANELVATPFTAAGSEEEAGRRALDKVRQAMSASLEKSAKAIDRAMLGNDPPPMLCRDVGDDTNALPGIGDTQAGLDDVWAAGNDEAAMFGSGSMLEGEADMARLLDLDFDWDAFPTFS